MGCVVSKQSLPRRLYDRDLIIEDFDVLAKIPRQGDEFLVSIKAAKASNPVCTLWLHYPDAEKFALDRRNASHHRAGRLLPRVFSDGKVALVTEGI
jgi:hypothetical protein